MRMAEVKKAPQLPWRPQHERPKVGIIVPTGDMVHTVASTALVNLSLCSAGSYGILAYFITGSDPAGGRNSGTLTCLPHGVEWFFYVDADMGFPPDTLHRLISHGKEIVGCDYRKRAFPFAAIGRMHGSEEVNPIPDDARGLVEVDFLGLGVFLVHRTVIEKMKAPWFMRYYAADGGGITEDVFFCRRAAELGFKVWCDMDLTREIVHVGSIALPWERPAGYKQPEHSAGNSAHGPDAENPTAA